VWFSLPMSPSPDPAEATPLPEDVAALKALLLAERAAAAKLAGQNEHLRAIVKELRRALFGPGVSRTGGRPPQPRPAAGSVVSIAARCPSICHAKRS
jgi:hypothetical protein